MKKISGSCEEKDQGSADTKNLKFCGFSSGKRRADEHACLRWSW